MASTSAAGTAKKARAGPTPTMENSPLKWREEDFNALSTNFDFDGDWGAEYPAKDSTVAKVPEGKIALYADFFTGVNFRLPVTKFLRDILGYFGLHITQLHPMGMACIKHFEFCCRALGIELMVGRFRCFYKLAAQGNWYSFNRRSGVKPHAGLPPRSLHDWRGKFFYINEGVIPFTMSWRTESAREVDPPAFTADEEWFVKLTELPGDLKSLPEHALVVVGMSRLWEQPDRFPILLWKGEGKLPFLFCVYFSPSLINANCLPVFRGKHVWCLV